MDLYSQFKYKLLSSAKIVEIGEQKLDELKKEWVDQYIDKDGNVTVPIPNNILNADIHEVGLDALDEMGWELISVSQIEVYYFKENKKQRTKYRNQSLKKIRKKLKETFK